MKFLITLSLFFSSVTFAQTIDLNTLKTLMTARQATLEKISVGMSKRMTGYNVTVYEDVPKCKFKQTTTQTVIKLEAEKALVLSRLKNFPANSQDCRDAGFMKPEDETSTIFYISKPSLANDLKDLEDMSAYIKSISRSGETVTIEAFTEGLNVTLKYDLTKPSFKNLILTKDVESQTIVDDVSDVDVTKIDLKKVSFCGVDEEGSYECSPEGDYSDLLF